MVTESNFPGTSNYKPHYLLILAVGVLLFIPSLWGGFLLDDFYYLGAIEGRFPDQDTDKSLFAFFVNDEAKTAAMSAEGGYPWWTDEGVRSLIFRPLSDLLLRLDYSLFGRSAAGYHAHSLLWWAATLFVCGLVFRRVLPGAAGVLAFLIFAVDEVHVMPVAWIANRNALTAAAAVLLGLWAWTRWRDEGWRPGLVLALILFAVGMAGGELALAALAYVLAFELFGIRASGIRSRLAGLAPLAVLALVYVFVYRLLGYGGAGSGVYNHPLENPVEFLTGAVTRIPTLLGSGVFGFSADLWFAAPEVRSLQIIAGCAAVFVLLGLLRLSWPDLDAGAKRALRWLMPGSLLSLLPIVAAFPSDRMLLVPGVGLAAALALVLLSALKSWRARRRRLLAGAVGLLALGHLVVAPVSAVGVQALLIKQSRESLELAASPVVRDCGGAETVVIFAPDHVVSLYMPLLIHHVGGPAPQSWRPLSIARCDHRLRRTGARTLELETAGDGVMMRSIFEELYRSPKKRLSTGTIIDRGLFRAEIMAEAREGPTSVAFHFDRDLTDPGLRFLVWMDGGLRRAELPEIGEELLIERTLGPAGF